MQQNALERIYNGFEEHWLHYHNKILNIPSNDTLYNVWKQNNHSFRSITAVFHYSYLSINLETTHANLSSIQYILLFSLKKWCSKDQIYTKNIASLVQMLYRAYSFLLALFGIQLILDARATVNSGDDLRFHKQLHLPSDFKSQFLDAEIFSFASQNHYVRNDRAKTRI